MTACLENAREAVERDPVRLDAESAERRESRRLWRAIILSPSIEVCEALLRGEDVPIDALDSEALARFRAGGGCDVTAHAHAASSSDLRRTVQPGPSPVEETLRLDDLPTIAAQSPGVERVTLDQLSREPTLDEALRDPALFAIHVAPYIENAEELLVATSGSSSPLPELEQLQLAEERRP